MMTGTELTEAEAFEMAGLEDLGLEDYSGLGNENVGANDIQVPYLNILQKMSPQVDEDSPDYIEGCKAGMLFQSVNKYRWNSDEGVEIIPVAYQRHVIEWVPREQGGGLVAVHPMSIMNDVDWALNDKNIPVRDDNGNLLVDTAQHVVMYRSLISGKFEPAMVSMKSTNHKKSRLWNSLIAQQTIPGTDKQAPRWLFIWRAKTVREEKDGNSWYNWEFSRENVVDKETFLRCDKLHTAHKQGQVSGADNGEADEIPF